MDQSTFEAADPLVDEIAGAVDLALTSDQLGDLRQSPGQIEQGSRWQVFRWANCLA